MNNETRKEYMKEYHRKNKERLNIAKREYIKNNPEQRKEITKRYRVKSKTIREDVIKQVVRTASVKARQKNLPFELTYEVISFMCELQNECCSLTGFRFDYKSTQYRNRPFAPSVDRVDNAKGYIYGNIQIVCTMVNKAKNEYSQEMFDQMCLARVERLKNG